MALAVLPIHVCCVCIYAGSCMLVSRCMCVHRHIEAIGHPWVLFCRTVPTLCFGTWSLTGPEVGCQAPISTLLVLRWKACATHLAFKKSGFWELIQVLILAWQVLYDWAVFPGSSIDCFWGFPDLAPETGTIWFNKTWDTEKNVFQDEHAIGRVFSLSSSNVHFVFAESSWLQASVAPI